MEAHFKRKKFKVLIGATRVLGEYFEMSLGEPFKKEATSLCKRKSLYIQGKAKSKNN